MIFRDYIHVMDLADSHVAAIKKIFDPNLVGVKIYNLGTGSGTSVLEMIKAFEEASGRKGTTEHILWPTLAHFGPLWPTLAYFGLLWATLAHFSPRWPTLAHSGPSTLAHYFSHFSPTF